MIGTLAAAAVAAVAVRARWLSPGGGIAAFLMGSCVFGGGGWAWAVPLCLFFVLSSAMSRVRRRRKTAAQQHAAKGSRRDAAQVIANGGVAWFSVVAHTFTGDAIWYPIYLASLAAATADTWATEIGALSARAPRSILTGKKVTAGTSGGITWMGCAASLAGAAALAVSATPYLPEGQSWRVGLIVTVAGLSGAMFDSVLGAACQARRQCSVCGATTEAMRHCDRETAHASGIAWLDNDAVNLLAAWSAAMGAAIILSMG